MMQLPEFAHEKKMWDMYAEFHVYHNQARSIGRDHWHHSTLPFVQFESGELIYRGYGGHKERGPYKHLNLSVIRPTVAGERKGLILTTPDGTPVPAAWLLPDQTWIIDWDQSRAYAAAPSMLRVPNVPVRFRSKAHMYWAGSGEAPVVGRQIKLSRPLTLSADDRKHLRDLRTACQLWCRMNVDGRESAYGGYPAYFDTSGSPVEWHQALMQDCALLPANQALGKSLSDLEPNERAWTAELGYDACREEVGYDYLTVTTQKA